MTPPADVISRIAKAGRNPHDRTYAKIKMRTDPAYQAVAAELAGTTVPVLDIGCGIGLLGFFLRGAGIEATVTGVDFDARKIQAGLAMRDSLGLNELHFTSGDARTDLPEHQGHVVILDILQFFHAADREVILRAATERVAPGACLIIRSGLKEDSLRFRITAWVDRLSVLAMWMKSDPVTYPTREEFESVLGAAGFEVEIRPLWGRTPFNNYFIVARRPAREAAS